MSLYCYGITIVFNYNTWPCDCPCEATWLCSRVCYFLAFQIVEIAFESIPGLVYRRVIALVTFWHVKMVVETPKSHNTHPCWYLEPMCFPLWLTEELQKCSTPLSLLPFFSNHLHPPWLLKRTQNTWYEWQYLNKIMLNIHNIMC